MTFLEQEKINAEATMFVETQNIEDTPADDSTASQADEFVIVERTEIPVDDIEQEVFDVSAISQADRSLPEEIVHQTIVQQTIVTEEAPVEVEEISQHDEPSVDVTDKSIASQIEAFIASEASSPPSEIVESKVTEEVQIELKLETPSAPVDETIKIPIEPQAQVTERIEIVEKIMEKAPEVIQEPEIEEKAPETSETAPEIVDQILVEQVIEFAEQPEEQKEKIVSQTEMFITNEVESSSVEAKPEVTEEKASETQPALEKPVSC